MSMNANEVGGTFNPSVFDDTPIPFNFPDDTPIPFNLPEHRQADINTVQLVRLIKMSEELTKSSLTTNVPSNYTIPQLGYSKRFAANGSGASYNHTSNNETSSGLSITSVDMFSNENSLLTLDSSIRYNNLDAVLDAVCDNDASDDLRISDSIENLDTSIFLSHTHIANQMLDRNLIFLNPDPVVPRNDSMAALTTNKEKKKITKPKRVIDLSTAIEPTENDILFGRGSKSNKHPGNIFFREKARELGSWFISCSSKEEKYKVSEVLVEFIKGENCRFLKKVPDGLWYEVVGNDTRKKASQALRDQSSAASSLLTTNVPSNNIIPQQCGKLERFAASRRDALCNPAPKKRKWFGKSGLSLINAGMFSSKKSQLNLDSLYGSD